MHPWTSDLLGMNLTFLLIGLAGLLIVGLKLYFLYLRRKIKQEIMAKSAQKFRK